MIIQTMSALLLATQLTQPRDFLKRLTPQDFKAIPTLKNSPSTCVIPLKEIHAANSNRIDPMEPPHPYRNLDKGIEHPVPLPVCPAK